MITGGTLTEIKSFFPEDQMIEGESESPFGNGGKVTVLPKSEEEIAGLLKYANDTEKKVNIMGSGTKRGFGGESDSADLVLSLQNFNGIVEHIPGDMTMTVKPGSHFKELQDYLAGFKQKIALDPFLPESATIGGIISANDSGPKRLGYGSARDAVIGLRVVYPDGKVLRSGGKVVKNVAGYDMNKLYIGAMGTLGVISEITLKLRPIPKHESLLLLTFKEGDFKKIKNFAVQILDSTVEPVALELLNPALSTKLLNENSYTLAVCFEDVENSVNYQEKFVQQLQPEGTKLSILKEQEAITFWNEFYRIVPNGAAQQNSHAIEAALKIGTINMNVLEVLNECQVIQDSHNLMIEAHGGLGHGLSQVILRGAEEDVASAIGVLRKKAEHLGGYAVVKHLPLSMRQKVSVWGNNPAYQFLLDGIKSKVDPNRVLNPGRFVGGI